MNQFESDKFQFAYTARDITKFLGTRHSTKEHVEVQWKFFRHGYDLALFLRLHFLQFPHDLQQDTILYPSLTLDEILLGAVLHDNGKADVSPNAEIWLNPEHNHTHDDWRAMRHHTTIGTANLSAFDWTDPTRELYPFGLPKIVKDIAELHHEKLDGSGPEGFGPDFIPHVIHVITIYDQIISRAEPNSRPYHERSFTLREAYEAVNQKRKTQYNPEILDRVHFLLSHNDHLQELDLVPYGTYDE